MSIWSLFFFLLLLVLGVCVGITIRKIRKDIYNPYFLKVICLFYGLMGVVFVVMSFTFFFQLT